MNGEIRNRIEQILSAYHDIDRRFSGSGGLANMLGLYEQIRTEIESIPLVMLDQITGEIRELIESLLKMDFLLRKLQNVKTAIAIGGIEREEGLRGEEEG